MFEVIDRNLFICITFSSLMEGPIILVEWRADGGVFFVKNTVMPNSSVALLSGL